MLKRIFLSFFLILNVLLVAQNNASDVLKINVKGIVIEMVKVEGGTFVMGCTDEQGRCGGDENPAHMVTLDDFCIGKYPVTQELWQAVMGQSIDEKRNEKNLNYQLYGKGAKYPMYYVSWNDCQEFIAKLNKLTGKKFRLPTESEWEYAARGGRKSKEAFRFSGSKNADEVGWNSENSGMLTHAVGQKKANELGVFDMTGNVWEWCNDWYDVYDNQSVVNPKGPEKSGLGKVLRGGSWYNKPEYCRVARRMFRQPDNCGSSFGFRLAM